MQAFRIHVVPVTDTEGQVTLWGIVEDVLAGRFRPTIGMAPYDHGVAPWQEETQHEIAGQPVRVFGGSQSTRKFHQAYLEVQQEALAHAGDQVPGDVWIEDLAALLRGLAELSPDVPRSTS